MSNQGEGDLCSTTTTSLQSHDVSPLVSSVVFVDSAELPDYKVLYEQEKDRADKAELQLAIAQDARVRERNQAYVSFLLNRPRHTLSLGSCSDENRTAMVM